MIDYFAIGLTHALLALAALRMVARPDLDDEGGGDRSRPRQRHRTWRGADDA